MARTLRASAMVFAVALSPIALADIVAQEFSYTSGAVKGMKVKTNTSYAMTHTVPTATSPGAFELLGSSELTVHVNAGDSDLFVYKIEGRCSVSGGEEDYLDLQARVNGFVRGVIGGPAFLQPQKVPASFVLCTGPSSSSGVVAKSWTARLPGGSEGFDYTFTIWWRAVDSSPLNGGALALLSHRTVKLTRYD